MKKKLVVLGMLGTKLDQHGRGPARWSRWRPTVSIVQQEDLLVDRFELLFDPKYQALAADVAQDMQTVSPETQVKLHELPIANPWDFESVYTALFSFAKSYPFDLEHEDYLVHITTGTHVLQICLFLLTESRILPAKILQTNPRGTRDNIGSYSIIDLDLSKYDRIAERFAHAQQEGIHYLKSGIDTKNAAFNHLVEQIARVSTASEAPILLLGPSGVGKTRMARLIYEWKKKNHRVTGQFVEVNCATLRGDASMSALFGHTKGAYTGAAETRAGLLSAADKGLLFLDEVGELGLDEQAMLLRALEEKRFYPLGSDREVKSNFQLICGTNRDLFALAAQGRFRSDLLARLNLWTFRLPGLTERPEDIAPNLSYELERAAGEIGHLVRFNKEAQEKFLSLATSPQASWSGNFRDLAGAVTRMAVLSTSGRITVPLVEEEWQRLQQNWHALAAGPDKDLDLLTAILGEKVHDLDLFDVPQLALVIRTCREQKSLSAAGRVLFAHSREERKTKNDGDRLRKYLARFDLTWEAVTASR